MSLKIRCTIDSFFAWPECALNDNTIFIDVLHLAKLVSIIKKNNSFRTYIYLILNTTGIQVKK